MLILREISSILELHIEMTTLQNIKTTCVDPEEWEACEKKEAKESWGVRNVNKDSILEVETLPLLTLAEQVDLSLNSWLRRSPPKQ